MQSVEENQTTTNTTSEINRSKLCKTCGGFGETYGQDESGEGPDYVTSVCRLCKGSGLDHPQVLLVRLGWTRNGEYWNAPGEENRCRGMYTFEEAYEYCLKGLK